MGKATGFLEYQRKENNEIKVQERIQGFAEFHTSLSEAVRRQQGARCMNCGVPLCQSGMQLGGMFTGCPLHNLIPEWNDEVYHGRYGEAAERLLKTNNFPEFTGRVCPALCEKACICGMNDDPVTIHDNELFIIEKAFAGGLVKPRIPQTRSGKKVAVVGSGPSGLAAADQLNHRGHSVTVYERDDRIGGLLMYGIPNMKLDKKVIERRRKLMEAEGVVFKTGVNVGKDISADALLKDNDAVILCTGAKEARSLSAKGMNDKVGGIYYAVDFLTTVTKHLLDQNSTDPSSLVRGKQVVIIGGGDTGNDCCGSSIRLGAAHVTQLEMMPQPPVVRTADNPWPEWPKILKTDYGQQEAISLQGADPRIYETTVKEVLTKKDQITAVRTVKVRFKNGKMTEVPGSEQELPCDLLLIAAGFTGCQKYTADAFGVALTDRGRTKTEAGSYRTNVEKVFTAGDMHRGQSLVVWGITEGRACALEVDRYLIGYTDMRA